MITVIIFVLAGVVLAIRYTRNEPYIRLPHCVMFGFLGFFLGALMAFLLPVKTHRVTTARQLITLGDNQSVKGTFFLGTGSIDGVMKFAFYTKDGQFFQFHTLPASRAFIRYTNGEPRILNTHTEYDKNQWLSFGLKDIMEPDEIIIEVPPGTIYNNFKLDAQ